MKKEQVKELYISKGWTPDKFGHLITEVDGRKYRLKFQEISVRYEAQATSSYDNSHHWVRIRSAYYKNLIINPENGKVKGWTK